VYCVKIMFSEHQYFGEKGQNFFSEVSGSMNFNLDDNLSINES